MKFNQSLGRFVVALDEWLVACRVALVEWLNKSKSFVSCHFYCNLFSSMLPQALAEAVNFIRKATGLGKLHKGVKKPTGEKTEVDNSKATLTSTSRTAFAGKVDRSLIYWILSLS